MKLALIGATGLVGRTMISVMEEFKLPVSNFFPVASARSAGKTIEFQKKNFRLIEIDEAIREKPEIVIYSAGSDISRSTAKMFTEYGAYVIDNSSAWRMDEEVPLVVPEVNMKSITKDTHLIANPNCSTIQCVVAIAPLHKHFIIKKLVISTYQSVTGTGAAALAQLMDERSGVQGKKVYPYPIDLNCFPHGGSFQENLYTTEEMKLVNETRKILNDNSLEIEPTVVRIPVKGGHSESVYIEFEHDADRSEIIDILSNSPGIIIQDEPFNDIYPMPLTAAGKNETFVGRIRTGLYGKNTLQMWIVADNLRKGAATNAVQIAEYIMKNII